MNKKLKFLNKGISTPVGILIILIFAILVGGVFVWQYLGIPKERIRTGEEEIDNWQTYCVNNVDIIFDIPKEFSLGSDYYEYTKNGCFDFTNFGYPMAGYTHIGTFANYQYPTASDPDKIIREKTKNAIEISIAGLNFPWSNYYYKNDYTETIDEKGVSLWEISPREKQDRWSGSIAVETQPSKENSYTHVVIFTIRTADPEQFQTIKLLFADFKNKIKTQDKSINWKIYRNEDYGYEVKYPREWYSYTSDPGDIYLQPEEEITGAIAGPHASAFEIKINIVSSGTTLSEAIQEQFKKEGNEGIAFSQENIKIGGIDGLEIKAICEGVGCGAPEWFIIKDNHLYHFDSNLGYATTFDQMLSTFQFLE